MSRKLSPPNLQGILPRRRLFALLDRHRKHPSIWVDGPPGAGKTVLVASYLRARRTRALWYEVDRADTDPAWLFRNLALAATRLRPSARRPLPQPRLDRGEDLAMFTRRFAAEFFGRLPRRSGVVLDNVQEAATDARFRLVLRELLASVPAGVTVFVIGRTDLPPELARLRALQQVGRVRWPDLRLTLQEAKQIARAKGTLLEATIRTLYEKSDGWVTAFVLLLEGAAGQAKGIGRAAGEALDTVFGYLAGEVFDRAPRRTQELLMRTAVLPHLSVAAAEAISRDPGAGRLLEFLFRHHLFTDRRDGDAPAYTYHALLREFLVARARDRYGSAGLAELRRRAAELLEAEGYIEAAMALYAEAGAWEVMGERIRELAPSLLSEGRHQTLLDWLGLVPSATIGASAWLRLWRGAAVVPFDPPGARRDLEPAYEALKGADDAAGMFLAWAAIVESHALEWADFSALDRWIAEGDRLVAQHPTFPSPEVEARFASAMHGALLFRQPQHPDMEAWAGRLQRCVECCPDPDVRILLARNLWFYAMIVGDFPRADLVLKMIAPPSGSTVTPFATVLLAAMRAGYCWHIGRPDESIRVAEERRAVLEFHGVRVWDFFLGSQAVYAALTAGDAKRGERGLRHLARILDRRRRIDLAHFHYMSGHAALAAGDPTAALDHNRIAMDIALKYGGPMQWALGEIAIAQAWHDRGDAVQARDHLRRGIAVARDMRSLFIEFQAFLCDAMFALDAGDEAASQDALTKALAVGRSQHFLNWHYFRPPIVARLAALALERGIEVEYVR